MLCCCLHTLFSTELFRTAANRCALTPHEGGMQELLLLFVSLMLARDKARFKLFPLPSSCRQGECPSLGATLPGTATRLYVAAVGTLVQSSRIFCCRCPWNMSCAPAALLLNGKQRKTLSSSSSPSPPHHHHRDIPNLVANIKYHFICTLNPERVLYFRPQLLSFYRVSLFSLLCPKI